jgi:VanZ family protein
MHRSSANRLLTHYLPLLIWLGFIFFASSNQTLATIHGITRKLAHFMEYAVLAFLAARAFRTSSKRFLHTYWFLLSFILVATYALLDEYHQSFVPSRTASTFDSLIDMVGGLTMLLVIWRRQKARTLD